MNTIKYSELKRWYLNDEARATAKEYFGDQQPSIHSTGFYSAPSWNWGYHIGIVGVIRHRGEPLDIKYFEVVTQFGAVVGARPVYIPVINKEVE